MQEAFVEARRALEEGEVPVGCVLVHDERREVLARGRNGGNASRDATRHAETVALQGTAAVEGCSLYVTLEPCIMCAAVLRQRGVQRVVYGASNDRFGGCGSVFNVLGAPAVRTACGVVEEPPREVVSGVMAVESVAILKDFYAQDNAAAPEDKRRRKG